jgi:hypothetical protein
LLGCTHRLLSDFYNSTYLPRHATPMHASRSTTMSDVEKIMGDYAQLTNHNIRSFLWRGVSVSVKDRQTHEDKPILNNVSGIVYAGELMAVMGPSYVISLPILSLMLTISQWFWKVYSSQRTGQPCAC